MFDFLTKPLLWAFRQSLGKDRGTAVFNKHQSRLNDLYKQLTPDEIERALDVLAENISKMIEAKKRQNPGTGE